MDRKFFFFRREIESPTSALFSDTGVGVSTIAIPSENLTFITSELGKVRFTFKDCNGFDEAALEQGESLLKTTITVSCRQGEEASLIEEIVNFMSRKTPKNIMKFDVVSSESTFREVIVEDVNDILPAISSAPVKTTNKQPSVGGQEREFQNTIAEIFFNELPVIDYNHENLVQTHNTPNTSWKNSGTAGLDHNLSQQSGATRTQLASGGDDTLTKPSVSIGSTNAFNLDNVFEIKQDYTIYVAVNLNALAGSAGYGIGALYGDLGGGGFGFGGVPSDNGKFDGGNTMRQSKNIFAVRHSKTDSAALVSTTILTGYPAFVDTTSTEDGTKSFAFPDVDPDAKGYDANHVFIIRRDILGNMFLHNRNGDIIGKLPAKTLEIDPDLTNSSDFRTDGDLFLGSIGEVGGAQSTQRVQLYRFGVINSDIGASEAANLAARLYSVYGGKRSKLTGTSTKSTKSTSRVATSTRISY